MSTLMDEKKFVVLVENDFEYREKNIERLPLEIPEHQDSNVWGKTNEFLVENAL